MAIVIGALIQPVLMFLCTSYVIGEGQYFDGDLCVIIPLFYECFRFFQMLRVFAIKTGPVLPADIFTLTVHTVWIDDLEQVAHQGIDGGDCRVEFGLYTFSVSVICTIECITGAVCPTGFRGYDAGQGLDESLDAS